MKPNSPVFEELKEGVSTAGGSPAGSDVDWLSESDLSDTEGVETEEAQQAEAPEASPAEQPKAEKAPQEEAPRPEPSPQTSTQGEVQPAEPAPQPVAAPETQQPAPPVDMQTLRAKEIERLTTAYAMNEEDARNMLVEPERVLPRMLANLHMNTVEAVMNAVFSRLPHVISEISRQADAVREAENEFYAMWPALKDKRYEQVVGTAIKVYRQLNPKASRQEVIRAAGLNAMITLRLPIPQDLLNATPQQQPQSSGFAPVAPGSAPMAPVASNRPTNPFILLNEEFDREERGQ